MLRLQLLNLNWTYTIVIGICRIKVVIAGFGGAGGKQLLWQHCSVKLRRGGMNKQGRDVNESWVVHVCLGQVGFEDWVAAERPF